MKEPFQVRVNDAATFSVSPEEAQSLDFVREADGTFHVLQGEKSYPATLVEADYEKRQYVFRIQGERFTVHIADHYERLIQELGLSTGASAKQNTVKAPMPGLVLEVTAQPGQSVQKGDTLLILEAMKMENVIKAAADGVVKAVAVQKGAAVEKGQLLMELE
jgi:biotin carboxyl carrier protein